MPLTCLCLFVFSRRDTDPVAAAIAAVLPLLTVLYSTYSVEARPYALMASALAFAAVAWQRASAPLWSFVLALTLVASVSIHYYAVFALLPFAAAELTWSVVQEGLSPASVAGADGGRPVVCRLLATPQGPSRRARPALLGEGVNLPGDCELRRVPVALDRRRDAWARGRVVRSVGGLPRPDNRAARRHPIPPDVPPAHCVLALGLLWLPWIALLAAKVGGGGVAARYTIGATLGLALSGSYVAYWLGRRASAVILMCLLLAFASKEAVFWGAEYYGRNVRRVDLDGFERLLSQGEASLPVVVTNGREFVPAGLLRASRHITGRLVALLDPQAARERTGTD